MAKGNYKEQNKAYLQQKATEPGIYTTAQGILYEVLESGSGDRANIRSIVSVYSRRCVQAISGASMFLPR